MSYSRSVLSKIKRRASDLHHDFVFTRATQDVVKDPVHRLTKDRPVLDRLMYGWHNEAWSADRSYLLACIDYAISSPGPILECRSGLSTLLIGAIAQSLGKRHLAIEHSPAWLARVRRSLVKYSIDSVEMCLAPIRRYSDFDWYDIPPGNMPHDVTLVICDGPPGKTFGGRLGLLPVMEGFLASECVILLDDAHRRAEKDVVATWRTEHGLEVIEPSERAEFMVIRMPSTSSPS